MFVIASGVTIRIHRRFKRPLFKVLNAVRPLQLNDAWPTAFVTRPMGVNATELAVALIRVGVRVIRIGSYGMKLPL